MDACDLNITPPAVLEALIEALSDGNVLADARGDRLADLAAALRMAPARRRQWRRCVARLLAPETYYLVANPERARDDLVARYTARVAELERR